MTGWRPSLNLWHPSIRAAADAAAAFVSEMERGLPGRWLTLLGDAGAGKTMLARQIFEQTKRLNPGNPAVNPIWPPTWKESAKAGENIYAGRRPYCIWFDARGFADRMRDGEWELPESTADDWCIGMDDLGTARDKSDFVADAMYRLANRRIGKWTIWTSNFTLGEIAQRIDQRVASRIVRDDNVVVTLDCGDYALRSQ